jgi:hypothetical protein
VPWPGADVVAGAAGGLASVQTRAQRADSGASVRT